MAKECSLAFYLLATVLTSSIHLSYQTIPHNSSTTNTSDKVLAKESLCLSRCGLQTGYDKTRSSNHSFGSPQNVKDSNCYRKCIKSEKSQQLAKRKNRSAVVVKSSNEEYACPMDKETVEQKLGDIQNISVVFLQQKEKNGNLTWIANVTWDFFFFNKSVYFSDDWRGFLVVWTKSSQNSGPVVAESYCRLNFKNSTNLIIKSGSTGWVYPDAIDVGVSIYPPTKDANENGFDLDHFDPKRSVTDSTSSHTTPSLRIQGYRISRFEEYARLLLKMAQGTTVKATTTKATDVTGSHPPWLRGLSIFLGCFVGVIIVGVVMYVMWRRRNQDTHRVQHEENFEYDASIFYSTLDEKWVTKELIPLLETQNNFKCFIHYRDFEVGRVIHESIADAVYKCRKNLAVVSRNFLSSNWCKEELSMALERVQSCGNNSLIVVNLDGVSKDKLPKALRGRTFVNLTSSQEQNTWKKRLVRQISVENEHAHSVPENAENLYVRLENYTRTPVKV